MAPAPKQKTALITGCSSGIGRALALEFASKGIRTIATARDAASLEKLSQLNENIIPASLDVRDPESMTKLKSKVAELTGGHLDYLVNNAGIHYASTGIDVVPDKLRELFEVNVIAVMIMVREFSEFLIAAKGVIVQIGSVTRDVPVVWQSPYNATKAALSQYSNTLRLELEPFGVRVVEIVTAYVQSSILRNGLQAPSDSIYLPIKDHIETLKNQGNETGVAAADYARRVVSKVTQSNPPREYWDGRKAWTLYFVVTMLPTFISQWIWKWQFKLDTLRPR